ncbi:hypothetical protein D3C76_236770 [compost metagenome]
MRAKAPQGCAEARLVGLLLEWDRRQRTAENSPEAQPLFIRKKAAASKLTPAALLPAACASAAYLPATDPPLQAAPSSMDG